MLLCRRIPVLVKSAGHSFWEYMLTRFVLPLLSLQKNVYIYLALLLHLFPLNGFWIFFSSAVVTCWYIQVLIHQILFRSAVCSPTCADPLHLKILGPQLQIFGLSLPLFLHVLEASAFFRGIGLNTLLFSCPAFAFTFSFHIAVCIAVGELIYCS